MKTAFSRVPTSRQIALLIFLLALAVRVALLCFDDGLVHVRGDSPDYLAIAESLKNGDGFSLDGERPTASRMPLYPMFLAGVLSLPGAGLRTIQLLQILIDCGTCLLVFFLAKRLLGKDFALIAGLFAALYVPIAAQTLFVHSETLFTFLFIASCFYLAVGEKNIWMCGTGGLLIGVATLVRPNGLVVGIFFAFWFLYRRAWRQLPAYLLCLAVVMTPWIARNAAVFHRFIPTFTTSGIALYNSYFIPEDGLGYNQIMPEHGAFRTMVSETDRSDYLTHVTIEHLRRHPLLAVKLVPLKMSLLMYPYDLKWWCPWCPIKFNVFWFAALVFALTALVARWKLAAERLSLMLFALGSMLATSTVFLGLPRYRSPYDPLIILLAAVGIHWMAGRERRLVWFAAIAGISILFILAGESEGVVSLVRALMPR